MGVLTGVARCCNTPDNWTFKFDRAIYEQLKKEWPVTQCWRMKVEGPGRYFVMPVDSGAKVTRAEGDRKPGTPHFYMIRETAYRPPEMKRGGFYAMSEVDSLWITHQGIHIVMGDLERYEYRGPKKKLEAPPLPLEGGGISEPQEPTEVPGCVDVQSAVQILLDELNGYAIRGQIEPGLIQKHGRKRFRAWLIRPGAVPVDIKTPAPWEK